MLICLLFVWATCCLHAASSAPVLAAACAACCWPSYCLLLSELPRCAAGLRGIHAAFPIAAAGTLPREQPAVGQPALALALLVTILLRPTAAPSLN